MPGSKVWLNIPQARTIFEKATKVNYKQVDDLAVVWCEYGEMELRHENYEQALRILRVRHIFDRTRTAMLQNVCTFFFLLCDETWMCCIQKGQKGDLEFGGRELWPYLMDYLVDKLISLNKSRVCSAALIIKCQIISVAICWLTDDLTRKKTNPLWI